VANFIAIDLQLYKVLKIVRVSFFWGTYCTYLLRHLEKILCRLHAEKRSSCSDGWVVNAMALRKSRIHSYTSTVSGLK